MLMPLTVPQAIPDVNFFLSLEPEELGAKLLFLAKERGSMISLNDFENEIWGAEISGGPTYPRNKKEDVALALAEAWAWLEAQGLIVPAPGQGHGTSNRVLSRRAQKIQSTTEFADFKIARLLPKEILHAKIADRVWGSFMRGEYDGTVFQAVKAVEVSVRELLI